MRIGPKQKNIKHVVIDKTGRSMWLFDSEEAAKEWCKLDVGREYRYEYTVWVHSRDEEGFAFRPVRRGKIFLGSRVGKNPTAAEIRKMHIVIDDGVEG